MFQFLWYHSVPLNLVTNLTHESRDSVFWFVSQLRFENTHTQVWKHTCRQRIFIVSLPFMRAVCTATVGQDVWRYSHGATAQQWGWGVHLDSFLHCVSVKYRRKLGVVGGIQGEVYHRFSGEDDFWAGPWEVVRIYSLFLGNAKRFGHILAAEKLFLSPVWHDSILLPLALA